MHIVVICLFVLFSCISSLSAVAINMHLLIDLRAPTHCFLIMRKHKVSCVCMLSHTHNKSFFPHLQNFTKRANLSVCDLKLEAHVEYFDPDLVWSLLYVFFSASAEHALGVLYNCCFPVKSSADVTLIL